jgi:hypothetical protein
MDCIVLFWQLPITPLQPKSTCTSSLQFRIVIYGSILALRQKDSKEVTRLLLISPRYWLIAAGDYTPTIDYVVRYLNDCSRFCCRWIVFHL